jgi:hypothetical protein
MKLKPLHAACALALAGMSSQAPAAITAFQAADINLYLSGASAPQNSLGEIAAQLFVDQNGDGDVTAGEDYFFYRDSNTSGNWYREYFGQIRNVPSVTLGTGADATTILIPASIRGKNLRLQDRAKGGSVWGVNPVARGEAVANMLVTQADCTFNTASTAPAPGSTGNPYACPEQGDDASATNPANRIPDFGVSDVEPRMFKSPQNVEFGADQLSSVELARFDGTTFPGFLLGFGVPATASVNVTNFGVAVYQSVLSGAIKTWNDVPGFVAGANTKTNMIVCRRVPGSGTQATYNQFFTNFPCGQGNVVRNGDRVPAGTLDSQSILDGTFSGDGSAGTPFLLSPDDGYLVIENSASGDVRNCLAAADNGGLFNWQAQVDTDGDGVNELLNFQTNFGSGSYRAVGTLSYDSTEVAADWTFRQLDGVPYAKATLKNGGWDFASELTFQYRNDNPVYVTATEKDAINTFIAFAADPNVLAKLTGARLNATLAVPGPGRTPNATNNVSFYSRNGNSCSPMTKR